MQQIKGAVLKSRLGFVEEHAGKDGLTRVLDALPPDDQRALKLVFTSNWYPFELGKRLDFLTQELNREANTITSKTNNMIVKENALQMKSEIEKIREQVQNVE